MEKSLIINKYLKEKMGQITPKPFKRMNKLTGRWELITPMPIEYVDNTRMKPINVRESKYKKKRY